MNSKFLTIIVCLALFAVACQKDRFNSLEDGIYANIETSKGEITLALYAEKVPLTVSNFVALAEGNHPEVVDSLQGKKYYDGLKFHRVLSNFMIQGGDPLANGKGGPGYTFGDEFPRNEAGDLLFKHNEAGVLAMANPGPNANGSQFFITHKATPWLDGVHSVFGKVVYGQNVVDSIVQNDTIKRLEILRIGSFAEDFDAPKTFIAENENHAVKQNEREAKLAAKKKAFIDSLGFGKVAKTASGLKIISLQKGKGRKANIAQEITLNLSLYLATGKLISKSDPDKPYQFIIEKQPLIAGVKEGILTMREGDKKRFLVPYYLGYGDRQSGPIPKKSDLIFEIEVLKVGK